MRLEKAKSKHRKGLWSPEEDEKLRKYVLRNGHGSWSSVPGEIGLQRNGKSCRLRWINYLRPGLKRGTFSKSEEEMIFSLHRDLGNKWSRIAQKLPGRTDNEIKNHWHTHMKKRSLAGVSETESQELGCSMSKNIGSSFSSLDYSSLKPVSSDGWFHNNSSTYTNPTLYSGARGLMPKVIFEEWLPSTKLNPDDDRVSNVLSGRIFMDDDLLFSLDDLSLEFECGGWPSDGIVSFPDYLGIAHRPSSEFSDPGSCSDHGICSSGFNQIYATSDVMQPWNLR